MQALLDKLAAAWPARHWSDVTVLVAVSGGADSVALLRGLAQLRASGEGRLIVAHYNHRLRGAESDGDQAFVEQLAGQLGCECVVGTSELRKSSSHEGESLEGAARQARYDFLLAAADRCGARFVATAHTADDQVETILFNLLRGTGLAGLAGIPRVRKLAEGMALVRPLLSVTRAEVLAWLTALGQTHREDASNESPEFTRNRIRHQLLPLLEREFNPQVRAALLRLGSIAHQADAYLDSAADELLANALHPIVGGIEWNLAALQVAPELVGRQALRLAWARQGWPQQDMNHDKWSQLWQFTRSAESAAGRQMFPGGIIAERVGGVLRLVEAS